VHRAAALARTRERSATPHECPDLWSTGTGPGADS
jgi:hypothetical protein